LPVSFPVQIIYRIISYRMLYDLSTEQLETNQTDGVWSW